eukprot:CAMPEP_0117670756 /NCGR_PEP_ID=MMETSP0804-20121206/12949_1 /TAXON_ID=1074897 /ORGANISM="Tetraselmis astigmatica, Strain CCMP880" /LENGTH=30 /DNA_ID= /DNA_START= /DNA_END= /DNA_ORIENTATION=
MTSTLLRGGAKQQQEEVEEEGQEGRGKEDM